MRLNRKLLGLLIIVFAWFVLSSSALAAGTVVQTITQVPGSNVRVIKMSWTADASDHTVPATLTNWIIDGSVFLVVTKPGAGNAAPTNLYDITLTDSDGVDIMGGTLVDRSSSAGEQAVPKLMGAAGIYGVRFVSGKLTMTLTNNSVNSATGTISIYYYK